LKLGFASRGRPSDLDRENLELLQKALAGFDDPQQVVQALALGQRALQQALNEANQEFNMDDDVQIPQGAGAANQPVVIPQWGQQLQDQMAQILGMLNNLQPAAPAQNAQADGQQAQVDPPVNPPPAQPPPQLVVVNVPPPPLVPPPPDVGGIAAAAALAPGAAAGAAGPAVVDDLNPTAQAINEAIRARQAIIRDNPGAGPADFKAALFRYTSLEPPPIYDMNEGARAFDNWKDLWCDHVKRASKGVDPNEITDIIRSELRRALTPDTYHWVKNVLKLRSLPLAKPHPHQPLHQRQIPARNRHRRSASPNLACQPFFAVPP